jgi:hypothetical protein
VQVDTAEQDADIFTKALPEKDHIRHAKNLRNGTPYVYLNWKEIMSRIKKTEEEIVAPILREDVG